MQLNLVFLKNKIHTDMEPTVYQRITKYLREEIFNKRISTIREMAVILGETEKNLGQQIRGISKFKLEHLDKLSSIYPDILTHVFNKTVLNLNENLVPFEVNGDEMSPYLLPGDIVYGVSQDVKKIESAEVYVIKGNFVTTICRIMKKFELLYCSFDNPTREPFILPFNEVSSIYSVDAVLSSFDSIMKKEHLIFSRFKKNTSINKSKVNKS